MRGGLTNGEPGSPSLSPSAAAAAAAAGSVLSALRRIQQSTIIKQLVERRRRSKLLLLQLLLPLQLPVRLLQRPVYFSPRLDQVALTARHVQAHTQGGRGGAERMQTKNEINNYARTHEQTDTGARALTYTGLDLIVLLPWHPHPHHPAARTHAPLAPPFATLPHPRPRAQPSRDACIPQVNWLRVILSLTNRAPQR